MTLARAAAAAALIGWAVAAHGQATVPFGGFSHDATQQVEIAADNLTVDQAAGSVVFAGGVTVGQGSLRLAAERMVVFYEGGATGRVTRIEAEGAVTLTNGAEAAEAEAATYDVAGGTVRMTGDVLLTQGENALSGEALVVDLGAGTARMEGRVRTILQPGAAQ